MLWRGQRIRRKETCKVNQIFPVKESLFSFRSLFPLILLLWGENFWWLWRDVLNLFLRCPMTLARILSGWDLVHMEWPLQFSFSTHDLMWILLACLNCQIDFWSRVILQLSLQGWYLWIKRKYIGEDVSRLSCWQRVSE